MNSRRRDVQTVGWCGSLCCIVLAGCPDSPSPTPPPVRQVIHICDWHYVPKDLFAADLRSDGSTYTDEEIDQAYADHLDLVEAIQEEQTELLRGLILKHGLKHVWVEGLTPEEMPDFQELLRQAKAVEGEQVPQLRRQLAEAERLIAEMESGGRQGSEAHEQAEQVRRQVQSLLDEQRERLLQIGAAARLVMAGELAEVKPLDDEGTHQAANPARSGGKVELDPNMTEAREKAIAQRLLAADEPVAVIVLGAAHDLADELEASPAEYSRFVTESIPR